MIKLHGIKKSYDGRTVLDVQDFTFARGGRYALIGPNGSGKSTLLRILAGTLKQDEGSVTYSNAPDTGYLPQSPHIFDLSVMGNVTIALRGMDADTKTRLALEALERAGLSRMAKARAKGLSGGEAQRLALARLIAVPHDLLLLDEPTSSTDIQAGDRIESALMQYCDDTGCTMVFSSHAPGQAQRLSTCAIVLDRGRIAEFGPAGDVLQSPQDESTREFLRHWRI